MHTCRCTETRMGSMVARKEVVDNITVSAAEVPDLDSNLIDRLLQYCVDHHRTKDLPALR